MRYYSRSHLNWALVLGAAVAAAVGGSHVVLATVRSETDNSLSHAHRVGRSAKKEESFAGSPDVILSDVTCLSVRRAKR
jgi:hypothetical protein